MIIEVGSIEIARQTMKLTYKYLNLTFKYVDYKVFMYTI